MSIRIKKGVLIISALTMFNFINPALEVHEVSTNNVSGNQGSTVDVTIGEGADFEGDSIAVMSSSISRINQKLVFEAFDKSIINKLGFRTYTQKALGSREYIDFGTSESYATLKGVTCFRGSNMRDGGSYGEVEVKEGKLKILWKKDIGSIDEWTGVGWNGQPAIVQWDPETIKNMNIKDEKKTVPGLKEVIYATLDGNVYFLDLEDGKSTRDRLNIGAPVKGSLTVDPRGLPILYVGQGIDRNGPKYMEFAYRIFSLTDFKKLYEIKGRDGFARRDWGAFDSTALIDSKKDYLFISGENGVVYSGKLNTQYENGKVSINPQIDKYRYDAANKTKRGIENSMAIYESYGYFADNDGILQCLDLNRLTPVWTFNVGDDTDSTVVLERDSKGLNLYTACEVDLQGNGGYSYIRKFDAASGKMLWENKYKCAYDTNTNGGALATPILGKHDISDMVIFNIAKTTGNNTGYLIAFDKVSGKEVWKLNLPSYCWSSPLAVYTAEGKSYIVQCDSAGRAMLIEGISGKILDTIDLGANVEGTPAAFGNKIVVGTRGSKIIGFEVR